ncbi:YtpI family protein [Mesobacillus foraminis]|uniref:YtpI-like protein n=1 Tax=Mesobacillus foraminis TaxID=279826 RepID=A0A4R2BDG9_9BACI|nr:YtpI family protein [Mesobacillus foraminis]TCN24445.1 YtpI-like protein [Mesobacillus foraminis]
MPVLVVLIVLSFAFYVFYKIKYVRSSRPAERQWVSAKSSIALGVFVALFGINQLYLFQTAVTYIVAGIFIVLGGLSAFAGFKAYKHYLPYAVKEAEEANSH